MSNAEIKAHSAVEIGQRVKFTSRAADELGGASSSYRSHLSDKRGTVTSLPSPHMALVLWDGDDEARRVVRHYLEPDFGVWCSPHYDAHGDISVDKLLPGEQVYGADGVIYEATHPKPVQRSEPTRDGAWRAYHVRDKRWVTVEVIEREVNRDGADVMTWVVLIAGDGDEYATHEFNVWEGPLLPAAGAA